MKIDRRDFLKLAGIGSVVFASGLGEFGHSANTAFAAEEEFFFIQLSDTHWGFTGPAVNPDSTGTLKKAVEAVNRLSAQPDFIVFTGDLSHVTDDDNERRQRLSQFRDVIGQLKLKNIRFMPGEHDAGLDEGKVYKEFFGETHYTFDHKGVHFIVLDNVSDPTSDIGDAQLEWMSADLKKQTKDARIVVFTHRPLYDLYPDWDWYTRDGAKAIDLLTPYPNAVVFHGHIHEEIHHQTGPIAHHAAKGLMWAFPPPGSVPKKAPIPWDASRPYQGLGFRSVELKKGQAAPAIAEFSVKGERL
jgi:Icc-related predicted phosphoesterase